MKCSAGVGDCETCCYLCGKDCHCTQDFLESEWHEFKSALRLKEGITNISVIVICGIIWGWWGVILSAIWQYISFNCEGGGIWDVAKYEQEDTHTKAQQEEWTRRCKKYGGKH